MVSVVTSVRPYFMHPTSFKWLSGTVKDLWSRDGGLATPVRGWAYQCQLNVPSLRGRLMSSILRDTGWRPSVADWASGMCVVLHRGPLVRYRWQWIGWLHTTPLYHRFTGASLSDFSRLFGIYTVVAVFTGCGCHKTPHRPHRPHRPPIHRYLTLNKQQE